ncbi:gamma-glutamylcyclotransferase family protein [Hyphococcus luteus]|nr:gamma-glutamylcyclotransferase family protein [Marinicaulis flavus]
MKTVPYFAYGSNMLTARLAARCPSARLIGPAEVSRHRLAFSKRSHDGSGKATLAASGAEHDVTLGILFEIGIEDMPALDEAEERGTGYDRFDAFDVHCMTRGEIVPHITYLARAPVTGLLPYDWYLALIVAGAREHELGETYVKALIDTPCAPDPQPDRPGRRIALAALNEAGYADEADALKSR